MTDADPVQRPSRFTDAAFEFLMDVSELCFAEETTTDTGLVGADGDLETRSA